MQGAGCDRPRVALVARLRNAVVPPVFAALSVVAVTATPVHALQNLESTHGVGPVAEVADSLTYNPDYFTPPSEEKKESLGKLEGVFGVLALGAVAAVSLGGSKGGAAKEAGGSKKAPRATLGTAKKAAVGTAKPPAKKAAAASKKLPAKPGLKAPAKGKAGAGAAPVKKGWF